MLAVPGLPAPIPLRLRSLRPRRMRMLAAWRQRRVLRCLWALVLLQSPLELNNFCQQKPHHCLGVWRPLRNLLFGDLQLNIPVLAAIGPREKPSFLRFAAPGCERLHSRSRGLPRLSEDKFGGASTRSVGKPASPAQPRGHDTLQAALANIPQPCGGDRRKAIFRSGLRQAWWRTVGMITGAAGRIHGLWKYKFVDKLRFFLFPKP